MNNFIQRGNTLTLTAPTGGVASGKGFLDGLIFAVAAATALVGAAVEGSLEGVYELDKAASQAWAVGDAVYWDNTNKVASNVATVGQRIGTATVVVGNGAGEVLGKVKLDGVPAVPGVYHVRKRFSVAEVNAGATILPAVPGRKYRMLDAIMIAIGGAAATATSVDILATLTTSRKLVAAAVAGLTQSAVARAGATNIAVLADGASFTANDVNTAVTIGKTGSDVATATHVDVLLTYAIDAA